MTADVQSLIRGKIVKLNHSLLLLVALSSAAFSAQQPQTAPSASPPAAGTAEAEDKRLLQFFEEVYQANLEISPQTQTTQGRKTNYGKLNDYTEAGALRLRDRNLADLTKMKAEFDYKRLSPAGQLNYRIFEKNIRRSAAASEWRDYGMPLAPNTSPTSTIPAFLVNQHRVDNVADAEAYISRLREVERVMNEIAADVRKRADRGIVPPKLIFAPVRADARKIVLGAPFDGGADSTLLADFKGKLAKIDAPQAEKDRLIAEASAALTGPFKKGYDAMFAALDYLEPKAKGNVGVWSYPRGDKYYENRLGFHTTTNLTADQIHKIGLKEVARIKGEMEQIKRRVGFKGTLEEFFTHIETDPRFVYPNSEEGRQRYLKASDDYIAQFMAAAPRYFHRLPKAKVESRAVEKWREGTAPGAFYNQPAPDGSRPGYVYYNLADMSSKPIPQLEATAYHEGAPGHHFQSAMQQELRDLPSFRRFGSYTAYGEGWGLYAERLGKELGFYKDPNSEFGMLSLELWRAARLVLDTGLHAKRWSKEQAIDYFKKNTLLSDIDIERETNRYILDPGQATAYKIGQLKILELRDKAKKALGTKFDIRDFHAVVLENGSIPLDILEEQVDAYIASKRS
jgi:uncharacterized protein (DUF885 family)